MRKISVLSFMTLDGVVQAPGGPEEDTTGDFRFGGWSAVYWDEFLEKTMKEQLEGEHDLLLGRRTYEIFASYWPRAEREPAKKFNSARKYVVSAEPFEPGWENSRLITGDVPEKIRELKKSAGPDLQVHGSSNLVQTLLEEDLADELLLKIFPLTLGTGKKLFGVGTMPAAFRLLDSSVSPLGVISVSYRRSGEVRTGSMEEEAGEKAGAGKEAEMASTGG